ncbi:MAG: NADH:flavin oxidoreductase [Actinomycetota bacterium]|nr:NADH:flavin oxidoreductase [Actinomycetota bacterium]
MSSLAPPSVLFSPLRLGPIEVANRFAVPAMVTRLSGDDGFVNDDIVERYQRFSEGGAGLVVVEATSVHGGRSGPLLKASSDEFIPGLARLASAVHDNGPSKLMLQIIHFLKVARSGWRQMVGELSVEELEALPSLFASAARRAEAAGFDGVELHMAHAYTLSSMLSRMNRRRDHYGRTLENRMRLPSMAFAAVKAAVSSSFAVGVRFDAEECVRHGYSVADSSQFAVRFAELGTAYVSLSAGGKFEDAQHREGKPLYPYTGYSGDRCMPGDSYPDAANIWMAQAVRTELRRRGHDTPVLGSGKIGTVELAEQVLTQGSCDLVGMARALLADPYLPVKTSSGRSDEIVRCIYCNVCKSLDENFKTVVCYLWPKGSKQAPRPNEPGKADISWPSDSSVTALLEPGAVRLRWSRPEGSVSGYDVLRSEDDAAYDRFTSCTREGQLDDLVVAGRQYRYRIVPYDSAGRRGEPSDVVDVAV